VVLREESHQNNKQKAPPPQKKEKIFTKNQIGNLFKLATTSLYHSHTPTSNSYIFILQAGSSLNIHRWYSDLALLVFILRLEMLTYQLLEIKTW
jgi:hypothetical protein